MNVTTFQENKDAIYRAILKLQESGVLPNVRLRIIEGFTNLPISADANSLPSSQSYLLPTVAVVEEQTSKIHFFAAFSLLRTVKENKEVKKSAVTHQDETAKMSIKNLNKLLKKAVEQEDYILAAKVRDEINKKS